MISFVKYRMIGEEHLLSASLTRQSDEGAVGRRWLEPNAGEVSHYY
jgi:hypothetical protein